MIANLSSNIAAVISNLYILFHHTGWHTSGFAAHRIYTNLSHQALRFGTASGLLITGQNPMRSTELLSTAFLCKHTNYIIRSTHKGGHVHYHIHQIAKTSFNCAAEFSWKARRPLIHTIGNLPGNYNKRPIKTANISPMKNKGVTSVIGTQNLTPLHD